MTASPLPLPAPDGPSGAPHQLHVASIIGLVPVGLVGVIPTKVSVENGAIRRGDILVSASTRGHAMRGTDRERLTGAVVGKALAEFEGPGTGVILVMVNVR